jgi:hypothetical protein
MTAKIDYDTIREAARLVTDVDYHCPDCLLWAAINADAEPFDIKLCWNECNIDRTMIPKLQEAINKIADIQQDNVNKPVLENDVNVQFRKDVEELKSRYNFLLNKITELEKKEHLIGKIEGLDI